MLGVLLSYMARHPEESDQIAGARAVKVTGQVLLVLSLLPLSLYIYQIIEEYRFRQLQTWLDDHHNEHTHRYNDDMSCQRSRREVDEVRSRDNQALALFEDDCDKIRNRDDSGDSKRAILRRKSSSDSSTASLSMSNSSNNGNTYGYCPGTTETTHLLAGSGVTHDDEGVWRNV